MNVPTRVEWIELSAFKGFGGTVRIDLDAEIVILTGRNGRGKTSVIEALELALTGPSGLRGWSEDPAAALRDLRNRGARGATEVRVGLTDGPPHVVRWEGADAVDGLRSLVDLRLERAPWQRWHRNREQLRKLTFVYADRLERQFQRVEIDSVVPESANLARALADGAEVLREMEDRDKAAKALEQKAKAERQAAVATARRVEEAASRLGVSVKLLGANDRVLQKLDLLPLLQMLSAQFLDGPPNWLALSGLADARAAQSREEELRAAEAHRERLDVRLRRDIDFVGRRARSERVPRHELLRRGEALRNAEARFAELIRQATDLQDSVNARFTPATGSSPSEQATGSIPLLIALKRADSEVLSRLAIARPSGLDEMVSEEIASYGQDRERLASVSKELVAARQEVETLRGLCEPEVMEAVLRIERAVLERFNPSIAFDDGDAVIRLDQVFEQLASVSTAGPVPTGSNDWGKLAEALRALSEAWPRLTEAVPKAESNVTKSLEQLFGVPRADRVTRLSRRLRGAAFHRRFAQPLEAATCELLRFYQFAPPIADELSISSGLSIRIGHPDSTSHHTLARSQQAATATALAIAQNLAIPEPVLGMLCIDDLSDSFDLENTTAVALLLRTLAYGRTEAHRQLILTSHDDDITEHLVPLLMPPKGHRLKVVRIEDARPPIVREAHADSSPRMPGGESPLRRFLPAATR